jgi:hypothetical protein
VNPGLLVYGKDWLIVVPVFAFHQVDDGFNSKSTQENLGISLFKGQRELFLSTSTLLIGRLFAAIATSFMEMAR